MQEWVTAQSTRLQKAASRVRKSSVAARLVSDTAMTADQDTQAYDFGEVPWLTICVFFKHTCMHALFTNTHGTSWFQMISVMADVAKKENVWGDKAR